MDEETAIAQQILHQYQHPRDCETRNYFIWTQRNAGMGSDIHRTGEFFRFLFETSLTVGSVTKAYQMPHSRNAQG
jgi:hypothetical protein